MDDADRAMMIADRALQQYHARRAAYPPAHRAAPIHAHCAVCGERIEPARLQANPYAARCIDCQSDYERGTRR